MAVTIIIPTCNRPEALAVCLRLLVPQIPSDGSFELLVSDDSAAADTREMLGREFPAAQWMRGPRRGPGANRNAAVGNARGGWVIFLDDDCLPGPGFLSAYMAAIAGVAAGSPVVLVGKTVPGEGPRDSLLWESPGYSGSEPLPPSCNFAARRDLFEESGGFDERFRVSFEDMEMFSRLQLSGVEIRFVPGAMVVHPMRRVPSAAKLAARWEARVVSTHDLGASSPQILRLLPRHVAAVIVSRFRNPKTGCDRLPAAFLFLAEYLCFLIQLPGWVWTVKKSPRSAFWERMVAAGKAPPRFGL